MAELYEGGIRQYIAEALTLGWYDVLVESSYNFMEEVINSDLPREDQNEAIFALLEIIRGAKSRDGASIFSGLYKLRKRVENHDLVKFI